MAQVVIHWASKCEALGSNLVTHKYTQKVARGGGEHAQVCCMPVWKYNTEIPLCY
jgi:hypothetical protein